jgi:hypothetical protein
MTVKKVAVLLTAIGIAAAAPLAGASEDGLDLMPSVRGIEHTQYVRDEAPSAGPSADAFYSRGTGGISPQ